MGEACLRNHHDQPRYSPSSAIPETQAEPSWYALKVRCGGEINVMSALKRKLYSPYCPMQQERRRYSDRMKTVSVPLFPGYLFCQFDPGQKLPIISTPGVDYIVGTNGPAAIDEGEIDSIRRMVEAGAQAEPGFVQGQRVRVTHGALEGVEGVLVRNDLGQGKLVVSITLLNQSASLEIDEEAISVSEPKA